MHSAALAAGVRWVRGSVGDLAQDGESVTALGLRARYLVGADGLHSRVRRAVCEPRPARGERRWGMRAHLPVAPWTDHVEVYWSPAGEAYVTPVAPDCVGVALLGGRGSFAERLPEFAGLAERLDGASPDPAAAAGPLRAAGPVRAAGPMRQDVRRRVHGRVLLVGDAAGYLDALTGEGLALAFGCAGALVQRIVSGETARYEHDYRLISRRYRVITSALLAAAGRPAMRSRVVPVAARAPWLFRAAVAQLAH
jgi:flavin-dependent dehydrogenase